MAMITFACNSATYNQHAGCVRHTEFRSLVSERGGGIVLQQLLKSPSAVVRLRTLTLISHIGSCSYEHSRILRQEGTAIQPNVPGRHCPVLSLADS